MVEPLHLSIVLQQGQHPCGWASSMVTDRRRSGILGGVYDSESAMSGLKAKNIKKSSKTHKE